MNFFVLLIMLILAVGLCFAEDEETSAVVLSESERFSLEITIGIPIHWSSSPAPYEFFVDDDVFGTSSIFADQNKTITANTAIGVSLLFVNVNGNFGFTLDADFFFGSTIFAQSPGMSASNSLFGINALFAPVFYLYNGVFLRIPLAIGLYMRYWSSDQWTPYITGDTDAWTKTRDFQLGPGIYLGVQFHLNKSIYFFGRVNTAMGIVRWYRVQMNWENDQLDNHQAGRRNDVWSRSKTDMAFGWHIKPALGIGIKF